MRIKLPGNVHTKKVALLILAIISAGILIYEGVINRESKNREYVSNSHRAVIKAKEESINIEENIDGNGNLEIENTYIVSAEENNLYNEVYTLFLSNEYESAIKKADALISYYPDSYMGYNVRGIAKAYNGDYEGGMNDIDKSLSIKTDYGYALFNKALTYELYEKMDKALEWYDKALEVEEYVWSYYGIASIYGRKGDVTNTMLYLNKAIEIDSAVKDVAKNEHDFDLVKSSEEFQKTVYN